MNINLLKTDYSALFSSLSTKSSANAFGTSGVNSFLSDYASIKNGSYGKLLKAYYAKDTTDKTSNADKYSSKPGASTSLDTSETLARIQSATDELKESADTLLETGSKSVFESEKEDAVYNAVSDFVKDYNAVLNATDDANSISILQKTLTMVNGTAANEKMLNKVGITINEDNSLTLDKEAFDKADKTTVKSVFNGVGSYAYDVSASASFINFKADNEAAKANTYNFTGNYGANFTSGSIFDSFL